MDTIEYKVDLLRALVGKYRNGDQSGVGTDEAIGILTVDESGYDSRDFLAFSLEKVCAQAELAVKNNNFDDRSASDLAIANANLDRAIARFPEEWIDEAREKLNQKYGISKGGR